MSLERHTGNLIFLSRRNAACAITTMAILHQLSGKNLFTYSRGGIMRKAVLGLCGIFLGTRLWRSAGPQSSSADHCL